VINRLNDDNEHCDKMIDSCINVLVRLWQSIDEKHLDILLTFTIREYLDEEDRVDIFKKLNAKKLPKNTKNMLKILYDRETVQAAAPRRIHVDL